MAGKRIDEITRQAVLRAYSEGLSVKMLVEKFSISRSSVNRILKGTSPQKSIKKISRTGEERERLQKLKDLERRINLLEKKILELRAGKNKTGSVWVSGFCFDGATMILDDSVTDGKPQTGSFARAFGGKKRVKDFFSDLFVDTGAGIANLYGDRAFY